MKKGGNCRYACISHQKMRKKVAEFIAKQTSSFSGYCKPQTKQNKTKQNKTKQNKTKQNKTKQNKTKQNKHTQLGVECPDHL
jgi:hypothetical protein